MCSVQDGECAVRKETVLESVCHVALAHLSASATRGQQVKQVVGADGYCP